MIWICTIWYERNHPIVWYICSRNNTGDETNQGMKPDRKRDKNGTSLLCKSTKCYAQAVA